MSPSNWTLWNNGTRELAIIQSRADRDVARAVRSDLERAALRDVTEAYDGYETARAAVALADEGLIVARENYRVQEARYKAGATSVLDLLTAQNGLSDAEAGGSRPATSPDWPLRGSRRSSAPGSRPSMEAVSDARTGSSSSALSALGGRVQEGAARRRAAAGRRRGRLRPSGGNRRGAAGHGGRRDHRDRRGRGDPVRESPRPISRAGSPRS